MDQGWGKLKAALKYSGVSKDLFETWCKNGLRFVRLDSGTRLFRFAWIDSYLEAHEVMDNEDYKIDEIVSEMTMGLKNQQ